MARKPASASGSQEQADGTGIETVDPTALGIGAGTDSGTGSEPASGGTAKRGGWPKGKPRGSRTAKTGKSRKSSASRDSEVYLTAADIAGAVQVIHEIGAMIFGAPQFRLGDDEALHLSTAGIQVAEHHNLMIPKKYGVWGSFFIALGTIYGPRLNAMWNGQPYNTASPARPAPADTPSAPNAAAARGGDLMSQLVGGLH